MARIRVLLADDRGEYRHVLREMLGLEPGIHVVGEAEDGREAVRLARELAPDLVLMDVVMRRFDGIRATREICSTLPGVKVLGLSLHNERSFVEAMFEAGASGYVLKDDEFPALVRTIRDTVCGWTDSSAGKTPPDLRGSRGKAPSQIAQST